MQLQVYQCSADSGVKSFVFFFVMVCLPCCIYPLLSILLALYYRFLHPTGPAANGQNVVGKDGS